MSRIESGEPGLAGCRVLVVEDDYFIADEMSRALRASAAEVVGPVSDVAGGLRLLQVRPVDCAVLDINLHGESVLALVEELKRLGKPWVFTTGYDRAVVPERLAGVAHFEKPVNMACVLRTLAVSCARSGARKYS